ncbi:MAG: hypothetical protein AAFO01_03830 [Pseudomonadota bacterium]
MGSDAQRLSDQFRYAIKPLFLLVAFCWLSIFWNLPVDFDDVNPGAAPASWPALFLPIVSSIVVNASVLDGIAFEILIVTWAIAIFPFLRRGPLAFLFGHVVALITLVLTVLCLTDLGLRMVLGRPFVLFQDLGIYTHVMDLQNGSFKGPTGWFLMILQLLLAFAIYSLALGAIRTIQQVTTERRHGAVVQIVAGLLILGYVGGKLLPAGVVASSLDRMIHARASTTVWSQVERSLQLQTALDRFKTTAEIDRFSDHPRHQLLAELSDIDVLLVFVESYGRSVLDQDWFRRFSRPSLDAFETKLATAGLVSASSYLTSPIMGGQSWLAHGTLSSGLWLPHQRYHDAFSAADRLTLTRAFRERGHRTVAIKPAITKPWPAGSHFGFERIYAAADMGYGGRPYNWATMPDQYTMAAFERFERLYREDGRPVFAEFALISSHAPWTHIPPVVQDWDLIGDGRVFSAWADVGDSPYAVWTEPHRLRGQYGKSIRYVLDMLCSVGS